MSSIQDRIRQLQGSAPAASSVPASSPSPPQSSVSTLAGKFAPSATSQTSAPLAQRASRFDKPPEQIQASELGRTRLEGRIATLNAADIPPALSVKASKAKLEKPQAPGSLRGLASKFESDTAVTNNRTAAIVAQHESKESGSTNDRRTDNFSAKTSVFEKEEKEDDLPRKLSQRSAMFEHANSGDAVPNVTKVAESTSVFEEGQRSPRKLSNRAAVFEGAGEQTTSLAELKSRAEEEKKAKIVEERSRKPLSVQEELQDVKSMNEGLVTTLLKLTEAFQKLEKSRDELQQKISRLEKK